MRIRYAEAFLLIGLLLLVSCSSMGNKQYYTLDQVITITADDGMRFNGRLRLPQAQPVDKLVIYVNGSGPNTYDDTRVMGNGTTFSYFDLFAQQCNNRGIGFFSYDTRGVSPSNKPPLFQSIDQGEYETYLPTNEISDVEAIIRTLHSYPVLAKAKIILLGWSSGTIVAPRVALDKKEPVDALILAGYVNVTMDATLSWQLGGESSMIFYCQYFDADKNGTVSRTELEADPYKILQAIGMNRATAFTQLDVDEDGILTAHDFSLMLAPSLTRIQQAIEENDDQWLAKNYGVLLTSAWFKDYRTHMPPNSEVLSKLDIPLHIFQGEIDRNTPVQGTRDIEATFKQLGKTNLKVHVFPKHDHNLNYLLYPTKGEISLGLQQLFDTLGSL